MINRIFYIFLVLIIGFSALLITAANYYVNVYGSDYINEILFYIATGLEGANFSVVTDFIKSQYFMYIILLAIMLFPLYSRNKRYSVVVKYKEKEKQFQVFPVFKTLKGKSIYTFIVLSAGLVFAYFATEIDLYVSSLNDNSTFIEDNYVDPNDVNITFPQKRRNLIVLYLESMEPTMMSEVNGGAWGYSVMPELEKLAMDNVNFSNTEMLGGMLPAIGTTWTVGGLVSTTAGIPLRISVGGGNYNSDNLLSGATTLGDILHKEGYNSQFIFGSEAKYGGRYQYFTKHGDYKIFDVETAIERNYMTEKDKVFWGFEDSNLFEWAKDEILQLSSEDEPFNFGLLTVNTHFPDGWMEKDSPENFPTQYENVHAHSSKLVDAFMEWLQEQSFYENTTVVLVGDHKSMQSDEYYEARVSDNYTRVVFNAFINAPINPDKEKLRTFTSLDIFPTILASIGAEIEGDRLGLGVNLFSKTPTLAEEYGFENLNKELNKKSIFYDTKFLADDYIDLQKRRKEIEEENKIDAPDSGSIN
ncbi:LTA synthase family protein [Sporosarcina sp. FA9]|uniref:LTA synthase family protein n=1 Tax=Sporosarcina sp. FA9 TaxID=3413030 RepID=UPI003F65ED85